jgi:hypothetical protein
MSQNALCQRQRREHAFRAQAEQAKSKGGGKRKQQVVDLVPGVAAGRRIQAEKPSSTIDAGIQRRRIGGRIVHRVAEPGPVEGLGTRIPEGRFPRHYSSWAEIRV